MNPKLMIEASEQAKIQEYKKELSTDEKKNRKNNNDCRLLC